MKWIDMNLQDHKKDATESSPGYSTYSVIDAYLDSARMCLSCSYNLDSVLARLCQFYSFCTCPQLYSYKKI